SKNPEKSAGSPTATKTRFASMPAGFLCTLIPEPFTLNRDTGGIEESRNQGTGYGVRCLPLTKDSPLPFPDSGILLRGSVVHNSM
ncbi:MAG: hypothetical protein P8Q54_11950, partial [Akkermansiaceae bacterium]|nr:hypothetical protein [Akkermansiaceae bacterium]